MKRRLCKVKIGLISCIVLLLSGCYSARQYVPLYAGDNPRNSTIYLLGDPVVRKGDLKVISNGRPIGIISSRGYLCWEEKPGTVSVLVKVNKDDGLFRGKDLKLTIEAAEGQCCYYQLKRAVQTVKNPDYSFGAGLVGAIGAAAMKTGGGSSSRPFFNEITITANELSEQDARNLLGKYKPPKVTPSE